MFILKNTHPKEFGLLEMEDVFNNFKKMLSHYSFWSDADNFNNDDITVEFSDAYEEQVYGQNSVSDIIEIIKDKYPNLSDNTLKKIEDSLNQDPNFCSEGIARDIVDELGLKDSEYQEIRDDLDAVAASKTFKAPIFGEFIVGSKKIILFSETIKNAYLGGATLVQKFEQVLIHELFHAFHHFASSQSNACYCYDELNLRNDYTSTVIKESLATYFEENYCNRYKIPHDKMYFSNRKKVIYYPYAGVMFVNNTNFEALFKLSLTDCDLTLRKLFYSDLGLFYDIKNLIEIYTVTKTNKFTCKSNLNPFIKVHDFPIYIFPNDPEEFLNGLNSCHSYCFTVFYKDGSINSHTNNTQINDLNRLKSNMRTHALVHNLNTNPRLNDISYAYAILAKY